MADISSYRDLDVWKRSMRLSLEVYNSTKAFPDEERFGLTSQLRRCSVSIPSNIAEGHARDSTKEYLHHLSFAKGSLAELETQLTIAKHLGMLPKESHSELLAICDEASRMITGLRLALRRKISKS